MAEAKKYGIVYADPPWRYDMKRGKGVAENHYPTMSMDEICALPVADLAAKDSALFLWATFPQLNEAFRVIEAWGFHYKTLAFLWLKQNRKADSWFYGMGFWTRSNAEVCLLATRGHPKRQCAGIHQFVISHIEQHSKKPDEVRDKIIKLMGDQPRVELFARQQTPGWDVWGNEVECSITLGKEVPNGVCTGPERPESCQDEGHVQPHKTPAHLLRLRCGCSCPSVLSVQKRNEHERSIHHYGYRSIAVHAFGYVRKERTAP